MITLETDIRIHYGDVDMMGFFYHSHYVELFETGRTEFMRQLGFSYAAIEAAGIMMPVLQVHIDYKNPAHYDDIITIKTTLRELPRVKVTFHHEVFRGEKLITTGSVTLAFMNAITHRPMRCPAALLEVVAPYFKAVSESQ